MSSRHRTFHPLWPVLAAFALPCASQAEEQTPAPARATAELDFGFVIRKDRLHVTESGRSANLGVNATNVLGISRSKDGTSLTVRYDWKFGCLDEEQQESFPLGQLAAQLENAEALHLHQKKNYAQAEHGFAKAVAFHPTFKKAVFNLACAQTRQGKLEAAVATLAGYLRDEPAETYAHVAGDPDLTPLLETPALRAGKSSKPGSARITLRGHALVHPPVLIAKEKGLLATSVVSQSWGSSNYATELAVFAIETGKQLFTRPLVGWSDTDPDGGLTRSGRKEVATRLASINRFLFDLGFSAAKHVIPGAAGDHGTMRFPGAGIGLVFSTGNAKARVLRKNEVLAEIDVFGYVPSLRQAWYLADEKLLVFTWHIDEPEGCSIGGDLAGAELVNLRAK
jgi:hypothetical protein